MALATSGGMGMGFWIIYIAVIFGFMYLWLCLHFSYCHL